MICYHNYRTLYEEFGLGHDPAVPVVGLHSIDGAVSKICLVDLQLGLVALVRHGVLLTLVQLSALLVPPDVGLGLAQVKVTGQGRRRLGGDLRVLKRSHDLGLLAACTAAAAAPWIIYRVHPKKYQ